MPFGFPPERVFSFAGIPTPVPEVWPAGPSQTGPIDPVARRAPRRCRGDVQHRAPFRAVHAATCWRQPPSPAGLWKDLQNSPLAAETANFASLSIALQVKEV